MKTILFAGIIALSVAIFGCRGTSSAQPTANSGATEGTGILSFGKVARHPHDSGAFTQGLVYYDGYLYESTGQEGRSSLRKVEIDTGKVVQSVNLNKEFFGEGLERVGDKLYQLTWEHGACFVFERDTLKYIKTLRYAGEGWGLAYDGELLILSDGTDELRFYDPENFKLAKTLKVFDGKDRKTGRRVMDINELEFIEGELWANIWKSTKIARIDPETGRVIGWVECAKYVPENLRREHADPRRANRVLNGIAYDPEKSRIFLTGKEWPDLYEIEIKIPSPATIKVSD